MNTSVPGPGVDPALERLPVAYREVIVLRHLEALPFAQVAERMGRSEDSVQKLWVRALANLRRTLTGTSLAGGADGHGGGSGGGNAGGAS